MTPESVNPEAFRRRVSARLDELVPAPDSGLLVGLSGGPDSVALLLAAAGWARAGGRPLAAAHLNHGLRGDEADADERFCRELCARLDAPLHVERIDPRAAARTRGGGVEEAGRHLRRRYFLDLLERYPELSHVATGHHRDDQLETVLMRLFRGAGPAGVAGMRPVSGRVIHPLLEIGRGEILAFLEAEGQPWRLDAGNLDGENLRARIRREFLPVVRGIFGPGGETAPLRLAELLADELALLDAVTDDTLAGLRRDDGLDASRLTELPPALGRRALHRWLAEGRQGDPAGQLARRHVVDAWNWLCAGVSGSTLDLPGGLTVQRDFDTVRLRRRTVATVRSAADYRILVGPADEDAARRTPGVGDADDESTWRIDCPAAALQGNLQVRHWRRGDRIDLLGLGGSKKLSDLLRERRIPRQDRDGTLVVADEAGILWVVGAARAERTRLLPDTTRMVTISVTRRSIPNQQGNDAE